MTEKREPIKNFTPETIREHAGLMRLYALIAASFLCLISVAAADENFTQDIYVPATSEGVEFIAPADGSYRFTITGGAAQACPPSAAPGHPDWHGWNTMVLIYKNRHAEWGGGPFAPDNPHPANWDAAVGNIGMQPTREAAESAGKGLSCQMFLGKNEYARLLVHDSRGFFHDNSGGVHLLISLVGDATQAGAGSAQANDCDSFDLLGEGKEILETASGTEVFRYGWQNNEYRILEAIERFHYEPGTREAFGQQWDFAPLGVLHTTAEPAQFGSTMLVWNSERYGEAKGRVLCDQTAWERSTGPKPGDVFRLTGTVDQPFSAPFIPDTSLYDFEWTLFQTATDVKKASDRDHGEYVSKITWEWNGILYAKPKTAFANRGASPPLRPCFYTGFDSPNLDEWQIPSGSWTVSDGVLASSGFFGEEIILTGKTWKNCRICFRMRFASGIDDFWVQFRRNFHGDPPGYSCYQIDGGTGKFRYQNIREKYRDISKMILAPKGDQRWHTFELVIRDASAECLIDGKPIVSAQRCPIDAGQIGFRTLNTRVEVDYVRVEDISN